MKLVRTIILVCLYVASAAWTSRVQAQESGRRVEGTRDQDAAARRRTAILAVRRLPDRAVAVALVGALEDADPDVRAAAAFALASRWEASIDESPAELLGGSIEGLSEQAWVERCRLAERVQRHDLLGFLDAASKHTSASVRGAAAAARRRILGPPVKVATNVPRVGEHGGKPQSGKESGAADSPPAGLLLAGAPAAGEAGATSLPIGPILGASLLLLAALLVTRRERSPDAGFRRLVYESTVRGTPSEIPCAESGCTEPPTTHGYCAIHYVRQRRRASP